MSGDLLDHELIPPADKALAKVEREPPPSVLDRLLADVSLLKQIPAATVTEMHRIHRIEVEDARKVAFDEAKARVQDALKDIPVLKDTKGVHDSKYVKVEKVCAVLDPLLAAEGFSWSVSETDSKLPNHVCVVLTLALAGHEKEYYYNAPIESAGRGSSALQGSGGRHTYAGRKLRVNVFGLHEVDDLDGANPASVQPITDDQARDLDGLIDEVTKDADHATRTRSRLLAKYGIARLGDLPAGRLSEVTTTLESMR